MAGADGDGQRVDARPLDESLGLVRIGDSARKPRTQALSVPVLDAAEAAELAFDRDAPGVGHLDHAPVVFTL